MPSYRDLLAQVKSEIDEVDATRARELLEGPDAPLVVDAGAPVAIAPTLVALLSDRVFGATPMAIGEALSAFAGTLSVVALGGYALVWIFLRRESAAPIAAETAAPSQAIRVH